MLLGELIGIFLHQYPSLVTRIDCAIANADAAALRDAAHMLKGSLATFAARDAAAAARTLEVLAGTGDLSGAVAARGLLVAELALVHAALEEEALGLSL